MFLEYILLQLSYSYIYGTRNVISHAVLFYIFTLLLSEACVLCPIWLFIIYLLLLLLVVVVVVVGVVVVVVVVVVPVLALNAYVDYQRKRVVCSMLRLLFSQHNNYCNTLTRRLGGPQSRYTQYVDEMNLLPFTLTEPRFLRRPGRTLPTI
jgi:hypothetical protein